jgi:Family of unknown function (DUF6527)
MNTQSCDMIRQTDDDAALEGPPGSFCITTAASGQRIMWFVLPDGNTGAINLRPVVSGNEPHPSWEWDGNENKPTLAPSVHLPGRRHGWFRDGRVESC